MPRQSNDLARAVSCQFEDKFRKLVNAVEGAFERTSEAAKSNRGDPIPSRIMGDLRKHVAQISQSFAELNALQNVMFSHEEQRGQTSR